MSAVSLELFKQHVRVDEYAGDDAYMEHLLAAAERYAYKAVNRTPEEMKALGGGTVPEDFVHALMLIAGHWYNNREAVGSALSEVPYTIGALLLPYRKLEMP